MRTKTLIPILVGIAVVAVGAIWYLTARSPVSPAGLQDAPLSQAEDLTWDELLVEIERMDGEDVREHGVRLFQAGDPDKAFLMFKTAARKGDGWSALAVGEMYDPATFAAADFDPSRTAFSKPNPAKALQWYDQALANGETQAQPLRERLIASLQSAAEQGDRSAERILKRAQVR